jgi:predicted N-acetyltransferase YhbS
MGGLSAPAAIATPPRPLTAADDWEAFDCGRESLNQWFRRHAWRNQEAGTSRTSVICDTETQSVVGHVSLATGQMQRAYLPKAAQRNRPDPIPIILLGQLAVDRRYQKRGCARSLLRYSLRIAVRISTEIGCLGVVTHPLDDGVRAFYGRFGFEDLPFDPSRSMFVRIVDLVSNGF